MYLDTRNTPYARNKNLRIVFSGASNCLGLDAALNQAILNEEVYVNEGGTFEFSALCDRMEFSLRFKDVEVTRSD